MGAVQNHDDKDADRKTNFFFIKYFPSSRIQGLTSLFWDGEEDGNIIYWVCGHWIRLSHTFISFNPPVRKKAHETCKITFRN